MLKKLLTISGNAQFRVWTTIYAPLFRFVNILSSGFSMLPQLAIYFFVVAGDKNNF